MALPGKVVKETLGTLTEEATKTTGRKTYKDIITEDIRKIDDDTKVEEVFEEGRVQEFAQVRQEDIKHEHAKTKAAERKVEAEINDYHAAGVNIDNNYDNRLKELYEKRRDLYIKAHNRKKELEATDHLSSEMKKGRRAYEVIYDMLSSSVGKGNAYTNAESRIATTYKVVSAGMTELKDKMRTKWAGLSQDLEFNNEVIRYLKDGQVKNTKRLAEVKEVAEQWKSSANKIKAIRAKAGAKIGDLEDWILPQSHNSQKIRDAKFNKWKKFIKSKLDIERIEKEQGADIDSVLKSAYKNITVRERSTLKQGGAATVNKGRESRVLHFKTGDDIIEYNKEFGNPDVFATMDNHIRSQSEEIGMMQVFGGNPTNTYNKLKEIAIADDMGDFEEGKLDALFNVVSGQINGDNVVSKADNKIAGFFSGLRSISVASKLGSATVSALADLSNIILGAGYRDLNSIKIAGRGLQGLLQEAIGGTTTGRNLKLANRIGVVSEFANASLANSRFADTIGGGFLPKAAETVIRASGLGSYTESMQAAFGLELAANIAENFGKRLDKVPFKNMLKEYGITHAEWDKIRTSGATHDIKGSKFFDVTKLYDIDDELAYKVSDMITNEMNAFIIMPGARTKVYTTAGTKKGTLAGELTRTATMFKSFPISIVMMHLNRASGMTKMGKAAYAGKLITTNLVIGTITLWAYDIATGKTPRSIDRVAMIGEALTKSGGLGIFGDFFIGLADTKYGHSFSDMITGVGGAALDDIVKSAQDIITKDTDKAVGNIYKRATSYIPGQNLWYTRAVIERTIGDYIGEQVDPDHRKRIRRKEKAMRLRDQELLFK